METSDPDFDRFMRAVNIGIKNRLEKRAPYELHYSFKMIEMMMDAGMSDVAQKFMIQLSRQNEKRWSICLQQ